METKMEATIMARIWEKKMEAGSLDGLRLLAWASSKLSPPHQ